MWVLVLGFSCFFQGVPRFSLVLDTNGRLGSLGVLVRNLWKVVYLVNVSDARFYELWLTRKLTNPRVGVIPSLFLD